MAGIVLGIATSHTPMLNASPEDWPRFVERDRVRPLLDNDGRPARFEDLLARADPAIAAELTPPRVAERHAEAQGALVRIAAFLAGQKPDVLIVIGDDHKEVYDDGHMPAFVVYRGETIPNRPPLRFEGPDWARRANARYFEESAPRDYPVAADLATHLIAALVDREFDVAASNALPSGTGEGHAFGFVHKRLMGERPVPIVPLVINTYFPPNQPTPRRCYALGQALRAAVAEWPRPLRVGVLASGGLSHFVVDAALDRAVIDALARKDGAALCALPREKLNSGSSEIRNWICLGGAVEHLALEWRHYVPGWRTPAGTGTGLGFALWA